MSLKGGSRPHESQFDISGSIQEKWRMKRKGHHEVEAAGLRIWQLEGRYRGCVKYGI